MALAAAALYLPPTTLTGLTSILHVPLTYCLPYPDVRPRHAPNITV